MQTLFSVIYKRPNSPRSFVCTGMLDHASEIIDAFIYPQGADSVELAQNQALAKISSLFPFAPTTIVAFQGGRLFGFRGVFVDTKAKASGELLGQFENFAMACRNLLVQASELDAGQKLTLRGSLSHLKKYVEFESVHSPVQGVSSIPGQITLDPQQQKVLDAVALKKNVFLFGSAGSGKSFLIAQLENRYRGKIAILAPTATAASNIGGQTIHSFFKLGTGFAMLSDRRSPPPKIADLIRNTRLLVIDEVSMVRADLLDRIDWVCRHATGNDEPMGGIVTVLVGDCLQLPPVVTKDEEKFFDGELMYSSPWFFDSFCFPGNFECIALTKIFRQKNALMQNKLNALRMGDKEAVHFFNAACARGEPPENATRLFGANDPCDTFNMDRLLKLPGPMTVHKARVTLLETDYKELEKLRMELQTGRLYREFSLPQELKLKVGARVMCAANNPEAGYVNGDMGFVKDLILDSTGQLHGVNVKLDNGMTVAVTESTATLNGYAPNTKGELIKVERAHMHQIPVRLAWGMTIHRAQGQTLESMVVENRSNRTFFVEGQLYVALSRAKSMEGLYLARPLSEADCMVSKRAIEFVKNNLAVPAANLAD